MSTTPRLPDVYTSDKHTEAAFSWTKIARKEMGAPTYISVGIASGVDFKSAPTAWYSYAQSEIVINAEHTDVTKHSSINYGLVNHEASHALHTNYLFFKSYMSLDLRLKAAIKALEEIRVEWHALDRNIKCRRHLRSSAFEYIIKDAEATSKLLSSSDVECQVSSAVLILGRCQIGIFSSYEVRAVRYELCNALGEDTVDRIEVLCRDFAKLRVVDESDLPAAIAIAQKLNALIDSAQGAREDTSPDVLLSSLKSEPDSESKDEGEGEGAGEGENKGEGESASKLDPDSNSNSDSDLDSNSDSDSDSESWTDQTPDPEQEFLKNAVQLSIKDLSESVQGVTHTSTTALSSDGLADPTEVRRVMHSSSLTSISSKVTSNIYTPVPDQYDASMGVRVISRLEPSARTTASVRKFAKDLEKLIYVERVKTQVLSTTPSGRLRTRSAMQASSQRARGAPVTEKMWETSKRKRAQTKDIRVGVMTDASGSMLWAQKKSAYVSYVLSRGVHHVGGRTVSMSFGTNVLRTLGPHEVPKTINVCSADSNIESANDCFAAMSAELDLLRSNGGLKVLFVFTDGMFTLPEAKSAAKWVKRLTKKGVSIFWMTPFSRDFTINADGKELACPVDAIHTPTYSNLSVHGAIDNILELVAEELKKLYKY